MSDEYGSPPVVNGPLDVDDYAIEGWEASWIASADRAALAKRLNDLDYGWNMNGQEDERERAFMRAIEDRLDELGGGAP